ncbi:hypothetical protein AGMMS49525_00690 [Bacteroidia bacterium]|nr:hypothetical protein AGMMS49525_00690 [Bacteroidia bacterium]
MKKIEKTQRRRILFISAAVLLSAGLWTLGTAQVKIGGDPTTPVTPASFPNVTTVTFPQANPTVKAKSATAVLANTTQLATEA